MKKSFWDELFEKPGVAEFVIVALGAITLGISLVAIFTSYYFSH